MEIMIDKIELNGYNAIIPAVSVGNVGQLAVDLCISSTNARKIGTIFHEGILPLVGANAFDTKSMNATVSTEIYVDDHHKFVFIQIRATQLRSLENVFIDFISSWLQEVGVVQLIILTSSFDIKKYPVVDGQNGIKYGLNSIVDRSIITKLKELRCIEVSGPEIEDFKEDKGTRMVMDLFGVCEKRKLSCYLLHKYSFEGDTRMEAMSMSYLLDDIYHLLPTIEDGSREFVVPPSWDLLYGNDPPHGLY